MCVGAKLRFCGMKQTRQHMPKTSCWARANNFVVFLLNSMLPHFLFQPSIIKH